MVFENPNSICKIYVILAWEYEIEIPTTGNRITLISNNQNQVVITYASRHWAVRIKSDPGEFIGESLIKFGIQMNTVILIVILLGVSVLGRSIFYCWEYQYLGGVYFTVGSISTWEEYILLLGVSVLGTGRSIFRWTQWYWYCWEYQYLGGVYSDEHSDTDTVGSISTWEEYIQMNTVILIVILLGVSVLGRSIFRWTQWYWYCWEYQYLGGVYFMAKTADRAEI